MVRMDGIDLTAPGARRRRWLRLGAASLLGFALGDASALEGGGGPQDPVAKAPWSGVGSLMAGQRLLSAVVIAPRWVLTAAHAVNGAKPAEVVFRSPLGGGFASLARGVHVHPAFISGKVDLALVELEQAVPADMAVATVFTGPLAGQLIHLVSHGGSTTLITRGENRIDALQPDASGQPLIYLFDFDGPDLSSNAIGPAVPAMGTLGADREATLTSGDSGSGAFVEIDGRWGLAGINTFQATVSRRDGGPSPRVAGGIVLGPQTAWMVEVMRAAARPQGNVGQRATP